MLEKIKYTLENIFKIGSIRKVSGANGEIQEIQIRTIRNIEDAMRLGNFGFNSKAPIDSRCIVAKIGNENIVIANEHIASIIDVNSGDCIMYNETGSYIKIVAGAIEFKCDTVTFDCNTIKHRGVSIDKNHIHSQPNDSVGNVEQNTNPPIN